MDSNIRTRLQQAERDFIDAISNGVDTMAIFSKGWSSLSSDITRAIELNELDDETQKISHMTASRVAILAECFLDFHAKSDALALTLESGLEAALASVTLEEVEALPSKDGLREHQQSYIRTWQEWLLENLHNPYPTKDIKAVFARDSNLTVKDVDRWFIDARKRIGWNALRRSHFSNKRQEIVNAATLFFRPSHLSTHLPPSLDMEFVKIERQTNLLFRHGSSESSTSSILDRLVESPPKISSMLPKYDIAKAKHQSHRKRRRGDDNDSDIDTDLVSMEPKRPRLNNVDMTTLHVSAPLETLAELSPSGIRNCSTTALQTRKRRLSSSDAHGFPKLLKSDSAGPRLYTVSDSLWRGIFNTTSSDDWPPLSSIQNILHQVQTDMSADLEFELFKPPVYEPPPADGAHPGFNILPVPSDETSYNEQHLSLLTPPYSGNEEFNEPQSYPGTPSGSGIDPLALSVVDSSTTFQDWSLGLVGIDSACQLPAFDWMLPPITDGILDDLLAETKAIYNVDIFGLNSYPVVC